MRRQRLEQVLNVDEMAYLARRRLPRAVFDAIEGGAEDEVTARANRAGFERLWLRPRALADVTSRDLSTTVLGMPITMPLMLDPCGMARMAHRDAELAAARAAASAGTVFVVSGASSYSLESIAASAPGARWFQTNLPPARADVEALLDRVEAAGYPVLCVTIDSGVKPKRERDLRNGLTIPLRITPRIVLSGLSRPAWTKDFWLGRVSRGEGFEAYRAARYAMRQIATTVEHLRSVTAEDIVWLRERWQGKLVVKGIQRGDECAQLVALGVDGLVVSNHGGRSLDSVRGSIDVLPEVLDAVQDRVEIFVDGGIRRGTDVLKALAVGARACLIGRPYMYGLAVAGEAGVEHVLEIFRSEIDRALGLAGCASVAEIDRTLVTASASISGTQTAT